MGYRFNWIESPVGRLKLVACDDGLAAVLWERETRAFPRFATAMADAGDPILTEAERQLHEYFAGARRDFALPLAFAGAAFQTQVWRALPTIPYGETRSYGEIAAALGAPKAARAVGAAVGANPISILAPCHRVLGAGGALTGFAGGLAAKAHLLALEGARLPAASRPGRRRPGAQGFGASRSAMGAAPR